MNRFLYKPTGPFIWDEEKEIEKEIEDEKETEDDFKSNYIPIAWKALHNELICLKKADVLSIAENYLAEKAIDAAEARAHDKDYADILEHDIIVKKAFLNELYEILRGE